MSNKTIADSDTPDPWMIAADGKFYLTFTLDNRVEIWMSQQLEDFRFCQKSTVWQPESGSPWSANIWAPELHYLNGTWYIYTTAAPPDVNNPGHRTVLLKSSLPDPMTPSGWHFMGPIPGLPDHWGIDATIFSPNIDGPHVNDLYLCWSGWPLGDDSDLHQNLFIIRMQSPEEADPETLRCISQPDLAWEQPGHGKRGIEEGPEWLGIPGFKGIVFSANGSWTSDYKLGLLALIGNDPLNPVCWLKRPLPLLTSNRKKGGPYGPGHASFITNLSNDESIYCIYHATEGIDQGWSNRRARVIKLAPECFDMAAMSVCCAYKSINVGVANFPTGSQPSKIARFIKDKASPRLQKWLDQAKRML